MDIKNLSIYKYIQEAEKTNDYLSFITRLEKRYSLAIGVNLMANSGSDEFVGYQYIVYMIDSELQLRELFTSESNNFFDTIIDVMKDILYQCKVNEQFHEQFKYIEKN